MRSVGLGVVLASVVTLCGSWSGPAVRARRGAPTVRMSAETSEQSFAGEQQLTAEGDGLSMPFAVRPVSIRPDGLSGAGMHFAEASLASTTGPLFSADDLPEGQILRPAQAIKGLYAAFNARDAACVASFLTEDCVYEDLLLGPATVCRGKEAFMSALQFHPAFVSSRILDGLPFAKLLPALTLEVDSIAEGEDTVGVEWHVQCGDSAFPLGRGLSQARVCSRTGKIERVVDIAEAPWRVIGLFAQPIIAVVSALSQMREEAPDAASGTEETGEPATGSPADGASVAAAGASSGVDVEREYWMLISAVLADNIVDPRERAMLAEYAAEHSVSDAMHARLLARAGWTVDDYRDGSRRSETQSVE